VLNQDSVNGQSGRIPQRFKLFCCIFKLHERKIPRVVKYVNDISRIIELLTDNDTHGSAFPTLTYVQSLAFMRNKLVFKCTGRYRPQLRFMIICPDRRIC
jgi:hypothetical protein